MNPDTQNALKIGTLRNKVFELLDSVDSTVGLGALLTSFIHVAMAMGLPQHVVVRLVSDSWNEAERINANGEVRN